MSYLTNISPEYLEELRELYKQDPKKVPVSWRLFFDGMEFGESASGEEYIYSNGHGNGVSDQAVISNGHTTPALPQSSELSKERLMDLYRRKGHLAATINPFDLLKKVELGKIDLTGLKIEAKIEANSALENSLRETYCGFIGCEFMYITDDNIRNWLIEKIEKNKNTPIISNDDRIQILTDLTRAEGFEQFLQKNYTGQKRFSLEGGESLIPSLTTVNQVAAATGGKEVVIGMAHRGRLNVLTNILKKPYGSIFAEFDGLYYSKTGNGGDVKYHMGFSNEIQVNGKMLHISLAFNPSHLEAVDPVVEGMARAKQVQSYGSNLDSVVPVLIHGDAAVIGQGVVVETMNLSQLEGYGTGGTVHIVVNNQLGFTTNPSDGKSSTYCTDYARGIEAPVFHVNGNKPEHVAHATRLATEFRTKFHRDAFVDIVCYRKYGHNEGDEPRFTQPKMYDLIAKTPSPKANYLKDLLASGLITIAQAEKINVDFNNDLNKELEAVKKGEAPPLQSPFRAAWVGFKTGTEEDLLLTTPSGTTENNFNNVITAIHTPPTGFKLLPKLQKMLETRLQLIEKENVIDWAVGEELAFGSLILDGLSVRLSGQDSRRGTFSHRHSEFICIETEKKVLALKSLERGPGRVSVWNSPLSEYAVMGFDYGFSLSDPKTLVLWEGQFGDFVNGAQIVIDQFLAASEKKWKRYSGLTLLLPHGYEGQGPEHSSARLERFLQLSAEGNWQVAYPTTPAQYFHLLRRQMLRSFRKPLIIMTPKSPLRMPEVVSKKQEFLSGNFQNIIVTGADGRNSKRVILCSGKIYWDLLKASKAAGIDGETTFVRIEQLYPLDKAKLTELAAIFKKVEDWVWVQEEPQNMGAWTYIFTNTYEFLKLRFAGRSASSSVSTGSAKTHAAEQEALVKAALKI